MTQLDDILASTDLSPAPDNGDGAFVRWLPTSAAPLDPARGNATVAQVVQQLGRARTDQARKRIEQSCQESTWELAQVVRENIHSDQLQLRAQALATLAELLDTADPKTAQGSAKALLDALDRANVNRSRYSDLQDPDTRRAAMAEFRDPSPELLQLILDAWGDAPPPQAVAWVEALVQSPAFKGK